MKTTATITKTVAVFVDFKYNDLLQGIKAF